MLVLASQAAFLLGAGHGATVALRSRERTRSFRLDRLIQAGTIANIATFPIALLGYTGSAIGSISFDLSSQGDVYLERYFYLISGEGSTIRLAAALSRALVAPLIYGAIIIGLRHWRDSSNWTRSLLCTSILVQVLFSFGRGTDKEIVDLVVFASIAWLATPTRRRVAKLRRVGALVVVVVLAFGLFAVRREARTGEYTTCFTRAQVCIDYETSTLDDLIGKRGASAAGHAVAYVTQGYHGLALTHDVPFRWTYGLGSSPVVNRAAATVIGDPSLVERTYQARLADVGWDANFGWTSLYAHLANDVTRGLVPVVFGLLGAALTLSWRRARNFGDSAALVVTAYLVLLFVYSPANNQVGVSAESLTAFGLWLTLYLRGVPLVPASLPSTDATANDGSWETLPREGPDQPAPTHLADRPT